MRLALGSKLDGYEILGLLGAGGMGEVYRARDPVLKREVAIKVLPPFVSQDSDRLRRFEQEAQAAAALNHPNILAVHRFGVFEGAPYLVSEMLVGGTLRQQLEQGPLAVRKAIDYGVQIAHGLAAAHDKGIVHRDLKPENLFVTKDGRIKILDFGLAKLMQSKTPLDGNEPTRAHATDPGTLMGTVGYMSPEQVRGKSVDHRVDIFAFGAILYEMLAGKRAFQRQTSADTMSAILNEDPPGISQIVRTTPPGLGLKRVVHRCLEKNPEQRFQSASDLAFALDALSESGISSAVVVEASVQRGETEVLLWSVGLIAVICLAAVAYYVVVRRERVPFEHYSIQKVIDSKHVNMVAISPDGAYLASVTQDSNDNQDLRIHHITTGSERSILHEPDYKYRDLVFSPDGGYIYFRMDPLHASKPDWGDEYRIPILGGQPTRVLERVDSHITFIDAGHRLCFFRFDNTAGTFSILSANADGGDEKVLANYRKPLPWAAACASNGRFAASFDYLNGAESLDLASGSKRTLASYAALGYVWLDDLLWASSGKGIFAISKRNNMSAKQLSFLSNPGGKLRQLTNDISDYYGLSVTADTQTIATTIYNRNTTFAELSLAKPTNLEERQSGDLHWFTWMDNKRIVESDLRTNLKVFDLDKNETTNVSTPKSDQYFHPSRCGPDALVVTGGPLDIDITHIYMVSLDGSRPTQLTKGTSDLFPECSADGKWLFYVDNLELTHPVLVRQSLQDGVAQRVKVSNPWYDISADGKLLAAVDDDVSPPRLRILSTDSLREIRGFPMSRDARESEIAFSVDCKSVFYTVRTGANTTIWRQPIDAATPEETARIPGKFVFWIRPSPDGKRLGLTIGTPTSEAILLHETR
ncbi:protein kinase domain-containing protein [Tunturiibacter lichenicola]|uniref:protein kinase domain-containing protein n=1 Tax=Tunturiibacter lichenicola TaxID=2051959 RepID=UPI003D9AE26A